MPIPAITEGEARRRLEEAVEDQGGCTAAARAWGLQPSYVSMVMLGRRHMGPKVSRAIGLKPQRFIVYRFSETS